MKQIVSALFFLPFLVFSQEFKIKGTAEASAMVSNESEVPFWFHTNTDYSIAEKSNISGTAEINASLIFSSYNINAGAAIFGRDGVENNIQRRDLYVEFENSWILATIGSKKRKEVFNGLSSTNQNFLWSGNARPLPGIILEANNPIKISKTFALDWGIAHYQLNDDRYVKDTRVHYKRFGLVTTFNEKHKLKAQIQHFAQWGGTSPTLGKLKNGFKDFVNVFFAHKTEEYGTEDETLNKLGNHLGSYLLKYEHTNKLGQFSFYHEHPFEDGSGTGLVNFPDGVWGITFSPKKQGFIASILYEYIDTVYQSGQFGGSGRDNYFTNSIYRSGWTYEENIIGFPFIIYNTDLPLYFSGTRFISNRNQTHHFGVFGHIAKFEWKVKSSYSKSLGTYSRPLNPVLKNWYNYGALSYKIENMGTFTVIGGMDFSNVTKTVIGAGIEYSYTF